VSGVAGNVYTLSFAKQASKGTPALASTGYKLKLTGGDLAPDRQLLTLQETDATRQQGQTVVVGARIMGTPEWYVRPADFGLFAYAALGATAVTGTAAPYTHTNTPANSPPYLTVWKNIGNGLIIDQYNDVRVSTLEISGGAGQAVACKADFMGLGAVMGATDNTTAVVSDDPFTYPEVAFSLGGSVPATTEQFTITINNNADFIQADNSLTPYDVVLGRLEVTGSFTYLLQSDADYRSFHTGTSGGTAMSTTLFEEAIGVTMTAGADVIDVEMAGAAFTAYPVPPDVSGKPIRVAATFSSLPQVAIADYISIAVTNSVATY
jgi:hypothetical protein